MTREQRLVFGEVAETYDRARPGYPDVVVDDIVARAPQTEGMRLLEVGCGTGKATVPFAARGFDLVALEPSEEMAAVARRNCASYPRAHDARDVVRGMADRARRVRCRVLGHRVALGCSRTSGS